MEVILKKLFSKLRFFAFFMFLLAMSQASSLSAVTWGNYPGKAGSSYVALVAQPGHANAQLLATLNSNLTATANPAAVNNLINATIASLQVDPKADGYYFIPKAQTPAYQAAATPGIQAVADALVALNAKLTAMYPVLADGVEVPAVCEAIMTAGISAALHALAQKLETEFLTVYNTNPAAMDGIPAVDALVAQAAALHGIATRVQASGEAAQAKRIQDEHNAEAARSARANQIHNALATPTTADFITDPLKNYANPTEDINAATVAVFIARAFDATTRELLETTKDAESVSGNFACTILTNVKEALATMKTKVATLKLARKERNELYDLINTQCHTLVTLVLKLQRSSKEERQAITDVPTFLQEQPVVAGPGMLTQIKKPFAWCWYKACGWFSRKKTSPEATTTEASAQQTATE